MLKKDHSMTPAIGRATRNAPPDNLYDWDNKAVAGILERPEDQGHTVNFKTCKQSYKSKKSSYNPEEKMACI